MSHFGAGGGGRTRVGTKVFLNIYDLNSGPVQDALYQIGCGFHHSGVEILGSEYSFASNVGIFSSTPKEVPSAVFREQYEMGIFEGGSAELRMALQELESSSSGDGGFGPSRYHLLRRNCNHFANALCYKLLQRPIPPHINRLSELGNCCSCLLPNSLLEHAPVGDDTNTTSSSGGGAPYSSLVATSRIQPFSGSGMKLGGSSSSVKSHAMVERQSPPNNNNNHDDLTDRRERARKAAMARMDKIMDQQQKRS